MFLRCLISTSTDVGVLSESTIIENYSGTDKEIVKFFNNAGKNVVFHINDCYLRNLSINVNRYCKNGWHVA